MAAGENDYTEIKSRLGLLEMTLRSVVGDMTTVKGLLTEHIKADKKRTQDFRKREDFFIQSVIKITGAAEKMEMAYNNMINREPA